MTTADLPTGLRDLVAHGQLPQTALVAAADHRDLLPALAERTDLPTQVVERAYAGAFLPSELVAAELLHRPLPARIVRHVLTREDRPSALAALAAVNVPDRASDRRDVLARADTAVAAAVLANPDWPTNEQLRLLADASGEDLLAWIADLDVEVALTAAEVLAGEPRDRGARILTADATTCLRALVRRPWLAQLPWRCLGLTMRSAAATSSDDPAVHYRAISTARRLARRGRRLDAAGLIEAVALNPTATLDVQRRAYQLTRRVDCHYLPGWQPVRGNDQPLVDRDPAGQREALDRLEATAHARHRTVWTTVQLAHHPQLAADVTDRLTTYLDTHLPAVRIGRPLTANLADHLAVDPTTRQHWLDHADPPDPSPHLPPVQDTTDDPGGVGQAGPARSTRVDTATLADCADPDRAAAVARRLNRSFGADPATWATIWALLRDGWTQPIVALEPIVPLLLPTTSKAA